MALDSQLLTSEIAALTPALLEMRRDFHRHPELAFEETRTAGILESHLQALGLKVSRAAGTGLIADLEGGLPGKTVMVRADIDALPILEETGAPYASQIPNVMHACGHDGHASVLAHLATVFSKHHRGLPGRFRFVFQPAEEIVQGAKRMLAEHDVLADVDAVLALHLWNDHPVGWVGVRPGPAFAAPDAFSVLIEGKGGHAATPHQAIDPIVIGAQLISGLQTLVSREVSPFDTAVVTIANLQAGTGAFNIIPQNAELRGTLRTFNPDLRLRLQERIGQVSMGIAQALGGQAKIVWHHGPPPVVNDASLTERFRQAVAGVAGVKALELAEPTMGGDDMAEFMERKPGVYFFVGSNDPSTKRDKPHHHPGFDFDDSRALPLALELMARAAINFAQA